MAALSVLSGISYESAPVPVREDLPQAHRDAWAHLAAPGSWWTGAERVALAAEVRAAADCSLCRERRAALSPNAVAGEHAEAGDLPAAAVDAAHRIATDAGRLTKTWFEKTVASGVSPGAYVEIVGIVVTVVSVDAFCRGLGVPPHPLPEPRPGAPTRYVPAGLVEGEAWVAMLPNGPARGAEADLWPGRRTANVLRALSQVPDEVRNLRRLSAAHYLEPHEIVDPGAEGHRALDRRQIELVAARVSALNECFY